MNLYLYSYLLIYTVLGFRKYYDYSHFRRIRDNCPELHIYMPDLHPHECVCNYLYYLKLMLRSAKALQK